MAGDGLASRLHLVWGSIVSPGPRRPLTLSAAVEKRLEELEADGRAPTTVRAVARCATVYQEFLVETGVVLGVAEPLLADVLTREHARDFVIWLRKRPAINPLSGTAKLPSASTVRAYASELKTLAKFCVRWDLLDVDPLVRLQLPKARQKTIERYTDAEVQRLLNVIEDRGRPNRLRNRAILYFLLDTGVRADELCSLHREAVDTGNGRAKVLGKGNKERWVYFSRTTARTLDDQLRGLGRERPVFATNRGPLTRDNLYQMITAWGWAGDVPNPTVHRFRHTFACRFLREHPGQIHQLQILLGHTTLDMVLRYAKLVDGERPTGGLSPVESILGPGFDRAPRADRPAAPWGDAPAAGARHAPTGRREPDRPTPLRAEALSDEDLWAELTARPEVMDRMMEHFMTVADGRYARTAPGLEDGQRVAGPRRRKFR
jgi:integrase